VSFKGTPANDTLYDSLTESLLLSLNSAYDKRWFATLLVEGKEVSFLLDTGSTANVLPVRLLTSLGKRACDL